MHFFANVINVLHEVSDDGQDYRNTKKKIMEIADFIKIAAVAFAVLGIVFTSIGTSFLFVSLPLFYLAFNGYHTANNLIRFAENPHKLCSLGGLGRYSEAQLHAHFSQNTVCFEWLINAVIAEMRKQGLTNHSSN